MTTAPKMARDFSSRPEDRYRYEPRARLRVKVRPARLQVAGHIIHGPDPKTGAPAEEQDILVPMSRVDEIKAMVADPVRLQAAREHFEEMQAEWCRDNRPETSPHSPSKSYFAIFRRDEPPLDSCEVIEENLDPPLSEDDKRAAAIARSASRGRDSGKRASK